MKILMLTMISIITAVSPGAYADGEGPYDDPRAVVACKAWEGAGKQIALGEFAELAKGDYVHQEFTFHSGTIGINGGSLIVKTNPDGRSLNLRFNGFSYHQTAQGKDLPATFYDTTAELYFDYNSFGRQYKTKAVLKGNGVTIICQTMKLHE